MSTTRVVYAARPGPATIQTDLQALPVTVAAVKNLGRAELTITTADDSGPSADAVNSAALDSNGQHLTLRLKGSHGGGVSIVQTGRGGFSSVNFSGGGGVFISGDNYAIINNGKVIQNGSGATVITGGSPILVTARVPEGSTAICRSVSGDIETTGRLAEVRAQTTSGDVAVDTATTVNIHTVSGDVAVDQLTGTADLTSTSGDVRVHGPGTARAQASTVSGDVRGTGGLVLDASSVSGRVRNR